MARAFASTGPDEPGALVRPVVLVVDDEPALRESFRLVLEERYDVEEASDGRLALEAVRAGRADVVLLDIRMPGLDGIEVLERIKAIDEGLEVILVTAVKTVRTAVAAMKLGAFDYLTKPFDENELLAVVARALEKRSLKREVVYLRSELARRGGAAELLGRHPEMEKIHRLLQQVARTGSTVLVTGESGTGKELVARAIHRHSPRRDSAFVAVNLAALADTLLESELFGHEKGAFTGAHERKAGRFELASGGTLFLDEIGTLKPELQAKLLRVLQEREIERVGGTQTVKVDVRIIAATNVDLKAAVARQAFREDLYYRLAVVPIHVPALRERREDIPLLVEHFVRHHASELKRPVVGASPKALAALAEYAWPGNVRELQNVIERAVGLVDGKVIGLADLPLDILMPDQRDRLRRAETLPLKEATEEYVRQIVLRALERCGWRRGEAARMLGVHRNSLQGMLARWGIKPPSAGGAEDFGED